MLTIEQIAKICHGVNRLYCEEIGDHTQPKWENAPDWQVESAINGVSAIILKSDSKPSDSHENWLKEKQSGGWVYGEVKDPKKKTHPCMVLCEELSKEQRLRDSLFLSTAKTLLCF